jgi:hypothetical protein
MNLNQFNPQALAALAGNQVGNLGLKTYGIESGMLEQAQMELEKLKLQRDYDQMTAQKEVQALQEQGMLNRQEAKQAFDLKLNSINQNFEKQYRDADRAVQIASNQQQALYQQGMLGLGQQRLDQDALFKSADLGMQQQQLGLQEKQLASEDAYRKGSLNIDQQKVDNEKLVALMNQAAGMKAEERQLMGRTNAFVQQILGLQIPDDQKLLMAQKVYDQAVELGAPKEDIAKLKGLDLQGMSQASAFGVYMAQVGDQLASAKGSDSSAPAVSMGANGQLTISQPQAEKNIDKELDKQDAILYKETTDQYTKLEAFVPSIQRLKTHLDEAKKEKFGWFNIMGPYMPEVIKNTSQSYQSFQNAVKDIAFTAKDAIYNLKGGTQGFTDTERLALESIASGGTGAYSGTAEEAANFLMDVVNRGRALGWKTLNSIQERRGNKSAYESWLQNNPKPEPVSFNTQSSKSNNDPLGIR